MRVALRWTLSIVFESFSRFGFQTDEANVWPDEFWIDDSSFSFPAISSDHELNVFFINPRTRVACHVPSDETRTPKSLLNFVRPIFFPTIK